MQTRFLQLPIFLVVILFSFEFVRACECMGTEKPTTEFRKTPVIFVGTVKSVNSVDSRKFGYDYNRYDLQTTFLIDESFKGAKNREIDIYSSSQGTACGISFQKSEQYLVYAYEDGEKVKHYSTSICTRTGFVEGKGDEMAVLRSLAKGKFEPRVYGIVYELIRGLYPLRLDYWDERRPMAGVKIIAKKGNKRFETVSEADGRFRMLNLERGKYKFEFIAPSNYKIGGDYWDETTEEEKNHYKNIEVEITENDSPDQLTVETRVDGRIKGKVFDQNGKLVGKDVMVSLISKETAEKEVGDIDYVHAYTDSNGTYEFFGIPQGEYYLGLNIETKPHKEFPYPRFYFPNSTDLAKAKVVVLRKGERIEGFNLTLPKPVEEIEVKGKVIDANGNPVKGAFVERYGLYYGEWREGDSYSMKYIKQPSFEGRVETNEKGEFLLKLLKGNKYRLNPFLIDKNSYKDLLQGDELDIEVTENMKPIVLVLDKKPK